MFWAPKATGLPRSTPPRAAKAVKGGHTTTATWPGWPCSLALTGTCRLASSASSAWPYWAASPVVLYIFQLAAMSGVRMVVPPLLHPLLR